VAWLPVGLLGIASALLFKKTGRLARAVILHMVYNAEVLRWFVAFYFRVTANGIGPKFLTR
jgi:membrane protease YdiL (CAAX protease family)